MTEKAQSSVPRRHLSVPVSEGPFRHLAKELKVAASREGAVIGSLQRISEKLSCSLTTGGAKTFAPTWVLRTIVTEFLKYSIEDDCVDAAPFQKRLALSVCELLESNDWVDDKLIRILQINRQIASKRPFQSLKAEVSIPSKGDLRPYHISGLIAKRKSNLFQVSREQRVFVSILEDNIANPRFAQGLTNAFTDHLKGMQKEEKVSWLCFVEKEVGPVGALGMLSSLVASTGMPACIYRAGYWSTRAKIVGCKPPPQTRVALVYDLCVSGDGIRHVADEIKRDTKAVVTGAVVLYDYNQKRGSLSVDGRPLRVRSVASDHVIGPEIQRIFKGLSTSTKHIRIIANGEDAPSSAGGEIVSSSKKGEENMNYPKWRRSCGSYQNHELRALTFRSSRLINAAVVLIGSDRDLNGLPWDSPDGRTLFVPKEAVPLLREKGLRFRVSELLTPEGLPADELDKMRVKHGM